jgi:heme oxygenase (biliverdin-IX-beta and delta-forming)
MDADTLEALARLIRRERVAALGTLRQGAPLVSMVAYLAREDFGAFHLRVSRLAWHTQDMAREARVSLAITETDDGRADPQTLMRVALRADARPLEDDAASLERLRQAWLARFPASAVTFELADFAFWRLAVRDARFVAGLGRTYNLSPADLAAAARQ